MISIDKALTWVSVHKREERKVNNNGWGQLPESDQLAHKTKRTVDSTGNCKTKQQKNLTSLKARWITWFSSKNL